MLQPHPVILRMRICVKDGNFSIRANFLHSVAIFSEKCLRLSILQLDC